MTVAETVRRLSVADLRPTAQIKVGDKADWVAVTEDAIWVGTQGPDAVQKIDPRRSAVTRIVHLPGKPLAGLALGLGALWAPLCGSSCSLTRIDLATERLTDVFPLPPVAPEGGVAVGAGSVWMAIDDGATLARIDPLSGALQHGIEVPTGSYNPLFHDCLIWITQAGGACVSVVSPETNAVIATIDTGRGPRFIGAGYGAVWTLNQGDGSLTRIDVGSKAALSTEDLETPGLGGDIAVAAGMVWTSVPGVPLSATDAETGRLVCRWEGPGGDSLGVGHGAIWLIDVQGGKVGRIDLENALMHCRA